MTYIDLHCHSTYSDGTLTPEQLIDKARALKLSHLAITDHDTLTALGPAQAYLAQLHDPPLTLISGIEITISYPTGLFAGKELHMLGLGFDPHNVALNQEIEKLRQERDIRNQKTVTLLQEAGIPITYEELHRTTQGGILTRTHFAKLIVAKGFASSLDEAFATYFRGNAPTNLPKTAPTPKAATELIHQAGGVCVIAHPFRYDLSQEAIGQLIADLSADGIDGVEAIYYSHSPEQEAFLTDLSLTHGLAISGGSDYHGKNRNVELGIGLGNLQITHTIWENLKKRTRP